MLRKTLMLSTALSAAVLVGALDTSPAQAAMRPALPTVELSPIQLVAYDPMVYRVQVALTRRGFNPGAPDGHFGPNTRNAIQAYQRANGMTVSGWLSESQVAQLESGQPPRAQRDMRRDGERDMRRGERDMRRDERLTRWELVRQTQTELNRHGYDLTYEGGRLNGETADAIRAYQERHRLEATGLPSAQLLAQMRRDTSNDSWRRAERSDDRMTQAELIAQTQYELRRHGYVIVSTDVGLNADTANAIRSYQHANGMPVDGMPSARLLTRIKADTRVANPPFPTTYNTLQAPIQQVQCADWLHQGRPGGSDYRGPPVPGCTD